MTNKSPLSSLQFQSAGITRKPQRKAKLATHDFRGLLQGHRCEKEYTQVEWYPGKYSVRKEFFKSRKERTAFLERLGVHILTWLKLYGTHDTRCRCLSEIP